MEATLNNREAFKSQREALLCLEDMDETTETRWLYKLSTGRILNFISDQQFELLIAEFESYSFNH